MVSLEWFHVGEIREAPAMTEIPLNVGSFI